jgi:hypothetical protein
MIAITYALYAMIWLAYGAIGLELLGVLVLTFDTPLKEPDSAWPVILLGPILLFGVVCSALAHLLILFEDRQREK